MKELDCRRLACPQPVLMTKDALERMPSGQITVIVDNAAARENVSRFAGRLGCKVSSEEQGPDFVITITKDGPLPDQTPEISCDLPKSAAAPRLVVRVANQFMGAGSDELGRILMRAFLKSLSQASVRPARILFYNSGIFLTCEGSESLEAIRELEQLGVEVYSCGTCLDFYDMKQKLAVGQVTNMFEIIESLATADRVVAP